MFFTAKTYSFHKGSHKFYTNYKLYTTYIDNVVENNLLDNEKVVIFTGMYDTNALYKILLQDNKYPIFRRLDILNDDNVYLSGEEKIVLMVHDSIEWQDKLSYIWKPRLLDKNHNYSIYLLN